MQTVLSETLKTTLDNKAETSFTFKVSGVKNFFSVDMLRFSETFFVRNMPFYVELVYRDGTGEEEPRLEAYLHCDYKASKSTHFSVETKVEFRLIR